MRFTQDHEFIEVAGDIATVGISEHAQQQSSKKATRRRWWKA
jgi:glycine cleavage system H lipoate-binding protein